MIINLLKNGADLNTIIKETNNSVAAAILEHVKRKSLTEEDLNEIKTATNLPLEVKSIHVSWIEFQLLYAICPDSENLSFPSSLAKCSHFLAYIGADHHSQWTYYLYDGFEIYFCSKEAEKKFSLRIRHGLERIKNYGKNIIEMIKSDPIANNNLLWVTNDSLFAWMSGSLQISTSEELQNQKILRSAIISIVFKAINKHETAIDCFKEIQTNLKKLDIPQNFEILCKFREQLKLYIEKELSLSSKTLCGRG